MLDWFIKLLAWPHLVKTLDTLGLLLMFLPAFSVERRVKRAHDFAKRRPGGKVDPTLRRGYQATQNRLQKWAQAWSPFHSACLYTGYACLFSSQLIRWFA